MTEQESNILNTDLRQEIDILENDMGPLRRRMEEDSNQNSVSQDIVLDPPVHATLDIPFMEDEPSENELVVEAADAVRKKLGKYKGFQGRARRIYSGEKFGDHRWSESQYSVHKQSFLREFIKEQCQPWKDSSSPYIFIDMFGGLGLWADKFTGQVCAGSPLCIYDTLETEGVNYSGMVFEKDKNRAEDLSEILYNKRDNITVFNQDNLNCVDVFNNRYQPSNYETNGNPRVSPSLLYFDYTRQADSDHIRSLTRQFPQTDVLIHYSATAFKRAINCGKCDKAKAHRGNAQYLTYLFGRRYWYINNWDEIPHNKFNFVSIYGTNVRSASILPEYGGNENILYPYASPRGHELRSKAELTKKEIKIQNSN